MNAFNYKSGELFYSFTFINPIENNSSNNVKEQYVNNAQQSRVYFAYVLLAPPCAPSVFVDKKKSQFTYIDVQIKTTITI